MSAILYAEIPQIETQKLISQFPTTNGNLGTSVSLTKSSSGDFAIVGAPNENGGRTESGNAYIFRRTGLDSWSFSTVVNSVSPLDLGHFGTAVYIENDVAIIGAPNENGGSNGSGNAYIFHRTGLDSWNFSTVINSVNPFSNGNFGTSVALVNSPSGDFAIVGAPNENGGRTESGNAYIFRRTGLDSWNFSTVINSIAPRDFGHFGADVDINNDIIVVGAPDENGGRTGSGNAYIFRRTGLDSWSLSTAVTSTRALDFGKFGASVTGSTSSISDVIVVGAPNENGGRTESGNAYIFRRTGLDSWSFSTVINSVAPLDFGHFGADVNINGNVAIMGAPDENGGLSGSGNAHVFSRTGLDSWRSSTVITSSNPFNQGRFGTSVDIENNLAVIGAPFEGAGTAPGEGTAYSFISALSVTPSSGTTSEAGNQATFIVQPSIQPTNDVIVTLISSDESEGTVNPSSLTLSGGVTTPLTFRVTGVDDSDEDGNQTFTITLSTFSPADARFNNLAPETVIITNIDDETPSGAGAEGSACFIATAAYGSSMADEVVVLSHFRDRYLMTNAPGKEFVRLYYKYSPPVARFLSEHDTLRASVRIALAPVVYSCKYPFVAGFIAMASGWIVAGNVVRRKKRS